MTTVDLITGFLGSGKTTFMKKYVRFLMERGENVCILENDFGAVNVDAMLLHGLYEDGCGIEMVSGACDKDCHKRRFKTKLIAMAMSGYTHVVIEPSGVFDVDEFFDTLRESPLDRWYSIGSVITVVDPTLNGELSQSSEFLLASQASVAGTIVLSRCDTASASDIRMTLDRLSSSMKKIRAEREPELYTVAKPFSELTAEDLEAIASSGCREASYVKLCGDSAVYDSVYFLGLDPSPERLKAIASAIMSDPACGHVFRIKGFTKSGSGWVEFNATKNEMNIAPIENGQSVVIVIGEGLCKEAAEKHFKEAEL